MQMLTAGACANVSEWKMEIETEKPFNPQEEGIHLPERESERCLFKILPETCTPYQYFEGVKVLEGYTPKFEVAPSYALKGQIKQFQDCSKDSTCIGYYFDGNGYVGTFKENEVESFCKNDRKIESMTMTKELHASKVCIKEFESDDSALENYWMPNVQYYQPKCPEWRPNCDLQRQCSKDTDLNEYYSWNENSKLCGTSNATKNTPTFCKFPGSGFTTYSKKKECEGKEFHCQKVEGNSSILKIVIVN